MELKKQSVSLPITNFEQHCRNDTVRKHSMLFPNSVRAIITGPSNCGKTNVLLNILFHPNGVKFENIYIYSRSLYQPKYAMLEKVIAKVPGIKLFKFHNGDSAIPKPEEAKENSVFIFDDVMTDPQEVMRSYFSMGRHKLLDVFYLAQTYARIPKHLIRDNSNFIIIFNQDTMNLRHIYDDYANSDMTFEKFKDLCYKCWDSENYGFLTISREDERNNGRYRMGLDKFINIYNTHNV